MGGCFNRSLRVITLFSYCCAYCTDCLRRIKVYIYKEKVPKQCFIRKENCQLFGVVTRVVWFYFRFPFSVLRCSITFYWSGSDVVRDLHVVNVRKNIQTKYLLSVLFARHTRTFGLNTFYLHVYYTLLLLVACREVIYRENVRAAVHRVRV